MAKLADVDYEKILGYVDELKANRDAQKLAVIEQNLKDKINPKAEKIIQQIDACEVEGLK